MCSWSVAQCVGNSGRLPAAVLCVVDAVRGFLTTSSQIRFLCLWLRIDLFLLSCCVARIATIVVSREFCAGDHLVNTYLYGRKLVIRGKGDMYV